MKKKKIRRVILGIGMATMRNDASLGNYCLLDLPAARVTNGKLAKYIGRKIRLIAEVLR